MCRLYKMCLKWFWVVVLLLVQFQAFTKAADGKRDFFKKPKHNIIVTKQVPNTGGEGHIRTTNVERDWSTEKLTHNSDSVEGRPILRIINKNDAYHFIGSETVTFVAPVSATIISSLSPETDLEEATSEKNVPAKTFLYDKQSENFIYQDFSKPFSVDTDPGEENTSSGNELTRMLAASISDTDNEDPPSAQSVSEHSKDNVEKLLQEAYDEKSLEKEKLGIVIRKVPEESLIRYLLNEYLCSS